MVRNPTSAKRTHLKTWGRTFLSEHICEAILRSSLLQYEFSRPLLVGFRYTSPTIHLSVFTTHYFYLNYNTLRKYTLKKAVYLACKMLPSRRPFRMQVKPTTFPMMLCNKGNCLLNTLSIILAHFFVK